MVSSPQVDERATLAKITRRLIPFMFVLYIVAYLDRINVGFAALQMNAALGLSAAVFGLGAGIFFVGYTLFEIPSNLVLHRVGARRWIARIMISWGVISAAMMFVQGAASFYTLRLLLGVAEAGFFPGMILYLTFWFSDADRARAVARFMTATAIAGVVGGPVSGALLEMDGLLGLAGWQWMFVLEGLPAVLLGVVVLRFLTDRPEQATWLAPAEREWLAARLARDRTRHGPDGHETLRHALTSGRVWALSFAYFGIVIGLYGISFWLPQIVQEFGALGNFEVGLLSAIPYFVAAVGMVWIGDRSDRTQERRWHVAVPALVASAGLVASGLVSQPALSLVALSVAALGIWGALGPFWALPTALLSGRAAAGGIALINSVGNVGGFFGPSIIGLVRDATGSFTAPLVTLAVAPVLSAVIVLALGETRRRDASP